MDNESDQQPDTSRISEPPDPQSFSGTPRRLVRLKLTPVIWVMIAGVAMLGVRERLRDRPSATVLNYIGDGRWVPIRHREPIQQFELLGVQVRLPDGWELLSRTSNDRELRPTFVHQSSGSIVQLFPAVGPDPMARDQASDSESPQGPDSAKDSSPPDQPKSPVLASDSAVTVASSPKVRWTAFSQRMHVEIADTVGGTLPLTWNQVDPRRIGRWTDGRVQVGMIAISPPTKSSIKSEIDQFCDSITSLP
ncbi:hypothetical protein K227x_02470 [Rubripirellula lacrimiformis]|uniref:Uncharacterized protein n=1 Tax=Rubripirellula lacrimiformis TaxID=1930273 RepID=A0A517N4E9_9BACT|nr:hypothetical protein [Rubripirellula lacrimiformis]QDT01878.1 hypothetical protein K227x_02470 [Rubripirellula lacrimiformis]